MQHQVLEYYQVCSNDAPGSTLTYSMAVSNLVPYAFVWEKVKTMDFSETTSLWYKTCRGSQLNEYMKLYEYQRSRSFIDLGLNHSDSIFLNFFSSITTCLTYLQHSDERYRTSGPLVYVTHLICSWMSGLVNLTWGKFWSLYTWLFLSFLLHTDGIVKFTFALFISIN